MSRAILYIVILGAIAIGGFFAGQWNATIRTGSDSIDPAETVQPGDGESGRKVLYWQSPMNPSEIYDSPGKSSMGMDLVAVYADGASSSDGSGTVLIDPSTVQNMGIRSTVVVQEDFSRIIRTFGEIDYDEEKLFLVNAKISGWIEKLYVNFVGEEVTKGDPLLEIYSPELVSTQEEYLLAFRNKEKISKERYPIASADAEKLLASARRRLDYWDIPQSVIRELESTGTVSKTIVLPAPATGIVVEKIAIEGAFIKAGMDLFHIADLTTIWVHASFYDNEVPWISVGQPVEMELSYLPGKTYSGRVSYIYPFLREKARDVHVRLIFSNPRLDLKPGMYANVRLQGKTIQDAIVIPTESVIRSGERAIVFLDRGEGSYEPREVLLGEVGGEGNSIIRVISGLEKGDTVVISAQFMLDSESRLQEAIQKMLAARKTGESPDDMEGMDMDEPDNGIEGVDPAPPDDMEGMDMDEPDDGNEGVDSAPPDDMEGMDMDEPEDDVEAMDMESFTPDTTREGHSDV